MRKGYKIGLIIAFSLLFVYSLGLNVYTLYFRNNKCIEQKCVEETNKDTDKKEEVSKPVDEKKDITELANFDINVVSSYSGDSEIIDGDNIYKSHEEIYLFDNGTYTRIYIGEIESSDYGTYYIDGNALYLNALLYGGNGSTMAITDIKTSKFKISDGKIYDYSTNKLLYTEKKDLDNVEHIKKYRNLIKYFSEIVGCYEIDFYSVDGRQIAFC